MKVCRRIALLFLFPILLIQSGCLADRSSVDLRDPYLANQREGIEAVMRWRAEARALWQHADQLQLEAVILSQEGREQNQTLIEGKLSLANELRSEATALADRASQLQQRLPHRMIAP
jgi:hypothetical protein